jgi:pyruvate,orthophosphate dikinase
MEGLPVTIRLLDPPLHEFLPHTRRRRDQGLAGLKVSAEKVKARVELHEFNPMLGHRGCRLSIDLSGDLEMQVRRSSKRRDAVQEANGVDVRPEIMIPAGGHVKAELRCCAN